jgi:hypothetical protein
MTNRRNLHQKTSCANAAGLGASRSGVPSTQMNEVSMAKLLARRLAATFLGDSSILPLFIICILSGLILFVAGERGLTESQRIATPAEMFWAP